MDITTLGLAIDSTGVNSASAALDKMAASGGKAETAATLLEKASVSQGKVLTSALIPAVGKATASFVALEAASDAVGDAAKSGNNAAADAAIKSARAIGALEAANARLAAAVLKAGDAQDRLNTLQRAGASPSDVDRAQVRLQGANAGVTQSAGQVAFASARADAAAFAAGAAAIGAGGAAAGKLAQGNEAIGKSAKFAAFQQQQLGFQLHDFFIQVQAGGSPLTAFIQQGSQLSGTFGGAGNAFRAVLGLLTPTILGIGALVGVVGSLGFALVKGSQQSSDFARALQLTGGFAGQTEGQFDSLVKTVASTTKATVGNVREFSQALIATGEIGPRVFAAATQAAVTYGQATGKTADEVAKDFASMARAPAKFALEANRSLNFITAAQYQAIKAFEDNGRAADAQGLIYDALNARFKTVNDNLGFLDQALNVGKAKWSEFWNAAFDIGRTETVEDRIKAAETAAKRLNLTFAERLQNNFTPGATLVPLLDARNDTQKESARAANAATTGGLLREQGTALAATLKKADDAERAKSAITGQAVIGDLLKRAKTTDEYRKRVDELTQSFARNEAQGVVFSAPDKAAAFAQLKKDFAPAKGPGNNDAERLRKAQFDGDIKAFESALADERATLQFHQRELQALYQAGNGSLRDFFDAKAAAIATGVQLELDELSKERARIEAELAKPVVQKNKPESERLSTQLKTVDSRATRIELEGQRATRLSALDSEQAFKALSDQVANYRVNLLQLAGDEFGAAKARADQAITAAQDLARQSGRPPAGGLAQVEVEEQRRVLRQTIQLQESRQKSSSITERLQIEEERIALRVQAGTATDTQGLLAQADARAKVIAALEEQVALQEQLAKSFPKDQQLALSTERARLEIDKLKASLDPLKTQFDGLFKDAGTTLFNDLLNNTKGINGAFKSFVGTIKGAVFNEGAKSLSQSVFGKGGPLGEAGGFLARAFGGGDKAKPALDTSAVVTSLDTLRTAGADPATQALDRLRVAADELAGGIGNIAKPAIPGQASGSTDFGALNTETPQPVFTGEKAIVDLFNDSAKASDAAKAASTDLAKNATQAAVDVARLAQAAGVGGNALSLLPRIIQAIQALAASSKAGGLSGLFSGSGSAAPIDAPFFHAGGVVGQAKDVRSVPAGVFAGATKYHTGGTVSGLSVPGLAANEIPAILMGGPKGTREEVLRGDDPRHRDNIAPALLQRIEGGSTVLNAIATGGVGGLGGAGGDAFARGGDGGIGGRVNAPQVSPIARMLKRDRDTRELSPLTKYLIGSPATVQTIISSLSKEADFESVSALRQIHPVEGGRAYGGIVGSGGLYEVNENKRSQGPELLTVGGRDFLMMGSTAGVVAQNNRQEASGGGVKIINNGPPVDVVSSTRDKNGEITLIIEAAAKRAHSMVAADHATGAGPSSAALKSRGLNLDRNLRSRA